MGKEFGQNQIRRTWHYHQANLCLLIQKSFKHISPSRFIKFGKNCKNGHATWGYVATLICQDTLILKEKTKDAKYDRIGECVVRRLLTYHLHVVVSGLLAKLFN